MSRTAIQFLAGANARVISRTLTAPLERIKLILQAQDPLKRTTLFDEFKAIKKESGFRGFFKGNGTNAIIIIAENALRLMFYEYVKAAIATEGKPTSNIKIFLIAGLSAFLAHTLIYPLEIVKTRLSLAKEGIYEGTLDCMLKIVSKERQSSLFKGWGVSVLGMVPNIAVDLTIFNILGNKYTDKYKKRPNIPSLLAFGALSSLCGQFIAYPFNVMRTRLQSQGLPGNPVLYDGFFDCAMKTFKNEGFLGFYRGSLLNFMRNVSAVSISYVVYEQIRSTLNDNIT